MALLTSIPYAVTTFFFIFLLHLGGGNSQGRRKNFVDLDYIDLALNLEYLKTEFFLFGALGVGMDKVAPGLSLGGPPPSGAQKANLCDDIKDIIYQFGLQEVGHLRAIKNISHGFARPQLNIGNRSFAAIMDNAFGEPLDPPFAPYSNDINYLLAAYVIPYVGLTGYVGASPRLVNSTFKGFIFNSQLVAGLLGVESGQDAVIRSLLYKSKDVIVEPYSYTVAEFTKRISNLRNNLGGKGIKDEGLVVDMELGAEGKITGNVLAGDFYSMAYARTPDEILNIVYGSKTKVGGFFPNGAGGNFAKYHNKM